MGDKCVQRLTHKDNEDSVKIVFGELGHMAQFIEAEYYRAEPRGSAVKIYVLTYKGRVCSGNNPLALIILCKLLL